MSDSENRKAGPAGDRRTRADRRSAATAHEPAEPGEEGRGAKRTGAPERTAARRERRTGRDPRSEAEWRTLSIDSTSPADVAQEGVLLAAAVEARTRAHARYSHFMVGAALETADGQIVGGCNIENATYGLTLCAERVALVKALSDGRDGLHPHRHRRRHGGADPAVRPVPPTALGVLRRHRYHSRKPERADRPIPAVGAAAAAVRLATAGITHMLPTIDWQGDVIVMVDQRKLPGQEIYVRCRTAQEVARAIRTMVIRGAPAIGVAAAMGLALGMRRSTAKGTRQFAVEFQKNCDMMASTRPTAVNLFWAIDRMKRAFAEGAHAGRIAGGAGGAPRTRGPRDSRRGRRELPR